MTSSVEKTGNPLTSKKKTTKEIKYFVFKDRATGDWLYVYKLAGNKLYDYNQKNTWEYMGRWEEITEEQVTLHMLKKAS